MVRHLLLGSEDSQIQTQDDTFSRSSKRRPTSETMTVQEIGLAMGMLTEDVATALDSMGVVEPDKSRKKRKNPSRPSTDGPDMTDDEDQVVKIRKSALLEWSRAQSVSLLDPVREEGFLGKARPRPPESTT